MDKILVLDFGGQYSHLIARRIRELGVYAEIASPFSSPNELAARKDLRGIVLSGGAASVYEDSSPKPESHILELDLPILGICYGHQLIAHLADGEVIPGESGEYGTTELTTLERGRLLAGFEDREEVWMNHKDRVKRMPDGFFSLASTDSSPVAAFAEEEKKLYGVQFHPEVTHTPKGRRVLENFVLDICGAERGWDISNLAEELVRETRETIGDKRAIIALSGGIDSSTAATLASRAIGENLVAAYVDTGLMRYKETETIRDTFSQYDLDLRVLDRRERFFSALEGVRDPERKREIIGRSFIEIFEELAREEGAEVLIQGTIYSDRIESGITDHSDTIKSHHNVGGLPEEMDLEIYEPLRDLYKDEVRELAGDLELPDELIKRHVFPGPGLAIRIVGEVTPETADIVRRASHIVETELERAGLYDEVWMAFAVLISVRSVGIQGDLRSYKYPVAIRVVESEDAMTANFARLPYDLLEEMSTRITNEIEAVNRVVYDISNKPPATMEWE